MLYDLSIMSERKVYVIQEIPGTQAGNPKINIIGAQKYGEIKSLLPELSQIIFSPGPLVFKLRKLLENYTPEDYFKRIVNFFLSIPFQQIKFAVCNIRNNRTCNSNYSRITC